MSESTIEGTKANETAKVTPGREVDAARTVQGIGNCASTSPEREYLESTHAETHRLYADALLESVKATEDEANERATEATAAVLLAESLGTLATIEAFLDAAGIANRHANEEINRAFSSLARGVTQFGV